MSSNSSEPYGFTRDWMAFYLQDRESWSARRLQVEYQCTYLNRETLQAVRRMLDAGCGGGFLVRYLEGVSSGIEYLGIDRSMASVTAARSRFPQASFLQTDVQQLPFADDAFDLAYARDVIIHAPAPYESIRELFRVARSVLLRIRTADVPAVFTARYRTHGPMALDSSGHRLDSSTGGPAMTPKISRQGFAHGGGVHHFLPLDGVLAFLRQLSPAAQVIRYRTHLRYPRIYDSALYENHGGFSSYFTTDLLIRKGRPSGASTAIIDDTDHSLAQRALRLLQRARSRSYLTAA